MDTLTEQRIGDRIRDRRHACGMTLRELEEQSTIGFTSISRFENGHKYPTILTLDRLCKAMGWTLSQFFRGLT